MSQARFQNADCALEPLVVPQRDRVGIPQRVRLGLQLKDLVLSSDPSLENLPRMRGPLG